ncbi:carboxypeptidase-like regulatory domain-containing protein [Arenimonas sp.]|uniref:carboxypeptidase-like regulatory domain-containing protein n=1 Tax=Arenimonas sp. TaxID=1872635 RepID=UPI0035B1942C
MRAQPAGTLARSALIVSALLSGSVHGQDEIHPEIFQDRVISPDQLAPLPEDKEEDFNSDGVPRSIRIEAVLSAVERADEDYAEFGLNFGGHRETERWGSFSLDGTVFRRDGLQGEPADWIGTVTLWQRGLYVGSHWQVENGLGVLNTPTLPVQREQFRFFLPSVPFVGGSTHWHDREGGMHLQAAMGRAGLFSGSRIVAFDSADGNVASFGSQWRWSDRWTGAVSALATDGLIVPDPLNGSQFQDGRTEAFLASTAWSGDRHRVQFNLQGSSAERGDATGAWLDGVSRLGRFTWNYGLFHLGEDLAWGALPINSNAAGGYLRVRYESARWNWNGGVDKIDSVSGSGFSGNYATVYGRYQVRHNLGIGGNINVRDSAIATDFSTRWFVDRAGPWGRSRLQLDQARTDSGRREDLQLTLDQDLPMKQGSRLAISTTLGSVDVDGEGRTETITMAALGGIDIGDRTRLDGNVRWTRGSGPAAYRGADINLSLNWRLASRWSLQASVYRSAGEQRSPFQIDPLAPPDQFFPLPSESSVFLSIRYEKQAGTPVAVLGGGPGSAIGTVTGSVFLDENDDGLRSASELPATNVTVILDGRYAVRTDSQGEFEFPRVAIGAHTIEVVPDNLPLPWFLAEDGDSRAVEVRVRDTTRVDIGARRQR